MKDQYDMNEVLYAELIFINERGMVIIINGSEISSETAACLSLELRGISDKYLQEYKEKEKKNFILQQNRERKRRERE